METKFTKGPWIVKSNGAYFDIGTENDSLVLPVYPTVCMGAMHHDEENAHLIAAAPEMYEMLESVKSELFTLIGEVNDQRASRITSTTENEPDYHDHETLYLIDKLLSKARGESCELGE